MCKLKVKSVRNKSTTSLLPWRMIYQNSMKWLKAKDKTEKMQTIALYVEQEMKSEDSMKD